MILLGDCVEMMRTLPDASVDAVVTDPPYGIGFMGHEWDQPGEHAATRVGQGGARGHLSSTGEVAKGSALDAGRYDLSPSANRRFQSWTQGWAAEALRVLKPGGHLVSFSSTRTYHRMAAGIEDAGFEIRDQLAWMFGSGFPKSLNVSKAIDRLDAAAERDERARRSQAWLREHLTARQIDDVTGTRMGNHLTTHPTQPFVPTSAMFDALRPLLPEVPAWLERLVLEREVESQNMAAREVIGERSGSTMPGFARLAGGEATIWNETRAHTPEAETWEGWGTALKPAYEPIVLARKPLAGTVAKNVLEHGTGALNIDGCRINPGLVVPGGGNGEGRSGGIMGVREANARPVVEAHDAGRWPANVVLDPEAGAVLDEQTGTLTSGREGADGHRRNGDKSRNAYGEFAGTEAERGVLYGDSGGASRFFYCAKTSTAERNAGLGGLPDQAKPTWSSGEANAGSFQSDGTSKVAKNVHPTVKPIALMRWLCRLVTPPGGVVLDPFLGSGTTGIAAALEGFRFIGVERSPEYVELATARMAWWAAHPRAGDDLGAVLEREASEATVASEYHGDLFG